METIATVTSKKEFMTNDTCYKYTNPIDLPQFQFLSEFYQGYIKDSTNDIYTDKQNQCQQS